MSNCVAFQTQLASIMEILVQAAVAEMGNLVDEDSALVLRLELAGDQNDNEVLKKKLQTQNEQMTTRFASIMGVLSKEAVDKITKLVDDTKPQLMEFEMRNLQERAQDHSLNILIVEESEEERSPSTGVEDKEQRIIVVKEENSPMPPVALKDKSADAEEDGPESPLIREVTLEDDSASTGPHGGPKISGNRAVKSGSDAGMRFHFDHQYCEDAEEDYDSQTSGRHGADAERGVRMGLLEQCEKLFKTSNLYEVLGVAKEASEAEIRRGYYKLSLQVHPDRAPDDQEATTKFQALGKVYAVLSDKEQRAVYNEQGTVDEETDSLKQERNWEEYWRLLFPKITVEDILEFEKSYKSTEEEKQDLSRLYLQYEGDMDMIMDSALCCTQEDEPRVTEILQAAIDSGELPTFRAFTHESKKKSSARKRKADKERQEAEEMEKELGLKSGDSLVAMLKQRQKSREQGFDSFLSDLEAKYSKKGKAAAGKKGKK
ncbi:hypothetical protein MATL_G00017120 [Megalops atlanticus]|uniref:DnaJ homolog subfamily C member 9 n=1 Tax=Megalops atlanticus TaxID=7932 RepID=A0A9D3QI73_MEGAT|nr:hypothetical protein MATL_G00017120 [Megalops atlanticus]